MNKILRTKAELEKMRRTLNRVFNEYSQLEAEWRDAMETSGYTTCHFCHELMAVSDKRCPQGH
jgi:hypothetical protein